MSLFDKLENARRISAINQRLSTSSSGSKSVNLTALELPSFQANVTLHAASETPSKKPPMTRASTLKSLNQIYDKLPSRIILYRHAESAGNTDCSTYALTPDHAVKLTHKGHKQAADAGKKLAQDLRKQANEEGLDAPRVFFLCSPYARTLETLDGLIEAFDNSEVIGVKTAVHLREQDFGTP